jgi:hypothetical protein
MGLHVELARFPIVVCRLGAAACQTADLQQQIDAYLGELSSHRGIFVCVHDWTDAGQLTAESWRLVFEQAILNAALSSQCVAQAVAVSSPELRGFATARTLRHPFSYALRVAASFDSALTWCSWQLRRSEPRGVASVLPDPLAR